MKYVPHYLKTNRKKIERKLFKAKKIELKIRAKLEDAQEIVKLWQECLNGILK